MEKRLRVISISCTGREARWQMALSERTINQMLYSGLSSALCKHKCTRDGHRLQFPIWSPCCVRASTWEDPLSSSAHLLNCSEGICDVCVRCSKLPGEQLYAVLVLLLGIHVFYCFQWWLHCTAPHRLHEQSIDLMASCFTNTGQNRHYCLTTRW